MNRINIIKLVQSGVLCALGVVFMLIIRFSILPGASYLEYDMGDIPIIISTLLLGYKYGYSILFIVSGIQALTVSAASSWEGFVMHFVATGLYITILYIITKHKKNIKQLIFAVFLSSIIQIIVMIPLNLLLTPLYLGCPVDAVVQLLLPAIIPFNVIKSCINSVITVCLFPLLSSILIKNGFIYKS